MKKSYLLVIFSIFLITRISAQTKKVETFYDYNKTKLKESFDAQTVSPYLKHGNYKLYSEKTKLLKDYTYLNGKKNGVCKDFYESGKLKKEYNYKDDKLNGVCTEYYSNGQVSTKATFKDDEINGSYVKYAENGNKIEEGAAYNKEKDGVIKEYWDNGKLYKLETYKKGIYDGVYQEYYYKGNLKLNINFKEGKKHGSYESYYDNGIIEIEAQYVNDNLEGILKVYYYNSVIWSETNFLNGQKNGVQNIYSPASKLKVVNQYSNDELSSSSVECIEGSTDKNCQLLGKYFKGTPTGFSTEWITLINSEQKTEQKNKIGGFLKETTGVTVGNNTEDAKNDLKVEYRFTRDFKDTSILMQLRLTPVDAQSRLFVRCGYWDIKIDDGRVFNRFNGGANYSATDFLGADIDLEICEIASQLRITSLKRSDNEEGDCGNELGKVRAYGGVKKLHGNYSINEEAEELLKQILAIVANN